MIRLRHRDRLSFDKIAQQLNRSPTTVRRLWAQAIRALQQRLG
ncbi:MAG: sigma factor-like helix-turn-helix DNA-binding protein [Planctomycetota bacterium]